MGMGELPPMGPEGEAAPEEPVTAPPPPPRPPAQKPEQVNLVPALQKDAEWLEKTAKTALQLFEEDYASTQTHRERIARHRRLYGGIESVMKHVASDAREPCLPLVTRAALRIWSRVLAQVMQNEMQAVGTGEEDKDRERRLSQHQKWQRRTEPEWGPCMSESIMQWVLDGSMFRKVGWDVVKGRKTVEYIPVDDFVMPYTRKTYHPDLSDVPRKTQVLRYTRHELEELGDAGYFADVDRLFADPMDLAAGESQARPEHPSDDQGTVTTAMDQIQGQSPAAATEDGKYKLIEQHTFLKLPGMKREKPVILIVECSSKRILRLAIRQDTDPIDRRRYDRELDAAKQTFAQDQQAFAGGITPPGSAAALGEPTMREVRPPRMRTTESFFHYKLFPNPDGCYGLGVGALAEGPNEIANMLMGEFILSARFHNFSGKTGYMSQDFQVKGGTLEIEPGKVKRTQATSEALQKGLRLLEWEPPSPALLSAVDKMEEGVDTATSAGNLLSGEAGPARETAASVRARMSSAVQMLSTAVEQFFIALTYEYKAYGRLNSVYMPDVEYFYVTEPDPTSPLQKKRVQKSITREEYEEDYDITFTADPRMVSDQELVEEAMAAYNMIREDPDLSQNPLLRLRSAKKALERLHLNDLAEIIPDEPPPPEEPQPMSQADENAGFMNEEFHEVQDDDDHPNHLAEMDEAEEVGFTQQLSPTGKQMWERHKRAHFAKDYLKGKALLAQQQGAGNGNGMGNGPLPGGSGGLGAGPGDGGSPLLGPEAA